MAWRSTLAIGAVLLAATSFVAYRFGGASVTAQDRVNPDGREFFVFGEAPNRYLAIQGTWEIEGEKAAFDKQVVRYVCREAEGSCELAEATVFMDALDISTARLSSEWSGDTVRIESPFPGECRHNVVIVSISTEEVVSLTTNAENRPSDCTLPELANPRRARLVDGFEASLEAKYGKAR
jgi:hypothetical protein